ncbi:hypothetical protein PILCRDRAFT_828561 [Piloderma croceum F 1598]|uniref:Aminoglycoside phosphotransferase domain-containing protein n=1 Tax=Piloderma croceum (strain F 1598) TaxID=765440 RepID=A0A0C3ENK0_PILCF|nr:hypothetical protein PILCRDRAFT_828561 [Piloderma croceum F 1598]
MQTDGRGTSVDSSFNTSGLSGSTSTGSGMNIKPPIEWDWDLEHKDRRIEAQADAAMHGFQPFQVDRKVLKDVVREKMDTEVGRIKFLSSGTFHKGYLITLVDTRELVARVARRFMPRLKTQSEVATLRYLRENTPVPVPTVYHYDSNPYNRLGGEYILMSKAPGLPLAKVYHSMPHDKLVGLLRNIALLMLPLFSHRFPHLGSLYFNPSEEPTSTVATPIPRSLHYSFSSQLSMTKASDVSTPKPQPRPPIVSQKTVTPSQIHVGPIVSWPFFGSNRGDDTDIDRGPWSSTYAYLTSCMEREITGVIRETEGKAAPHRLHLDPDEINSSRHHHIQAVPGDQSDDSEEWDLEESEEEWDGPGDTMYRDYRRMQRSTFLVAHAVQREQAVRTEMERWITVMMRLGAGGEPGTEVFGLDCHDLSLENIFVDDNDHSKITCIIDWESTTTRPLWACAHLPAFLLSSPFTAKLFRDAVSKIANSNRSSTVLPNAGTNPKDYDLAALAAEWLYYEKSGSRLRMAHRCVEWDGWEEGLVESILGPEELEAVWFDEADARNGIDATPPLDSADDSQTSRSEDILVASLKRRKPAVKLPFAKEGEKEQMLNHTGDICGGRGGELGRRLEAWLSVNGSGLTETSPAVRRWDDEDKEYEAEAE